MFATKKFVNLYWSIFLLISVTLAFGCSNTTEPNNSLEMDSPIITPDLNASINDSPIPEPIATVSMPTATAIPQIGPDFTITAGVQPGDTMVTGTGPAGLGIKIVDINMVGEVRGEGIIADDGTFEIAVDSVVGGNTLGIIISSLGNTDYIAEDFVNNENYRSIPMIGLVVASYKVPAE